jgi:hypothetical protein
MPLVPKLQIIESSQNVYLMVENIYPKSEMNSKSFPITLYTNMKLGKAYERGSR